MEGRNILIENFFSLFSHGPTGTGPAVAGPRSTNRADFFAAAAIPASRAGPSRRFKAWRAMIEPSGSRHNRRPRAPNRVAVAYEVGKILLGHRVRPALGRHCLALWLSTDRMRTWPLRRVIDERRGELLTDPDGFLDADDNCIHLVYNISRAQALYRRVTLPAE